MRLDLPSKRAGEQGQSAQCALDFGSYLLFPVEKPPDGWAERRASRLHLIRRGSEAGER